MGNVYLTPKVRDKDISIEEIDDSCEVLCISHAEPRIELDDEMYFGRVKKVRASILKQSYIPPNPEPSEEPSEEPPTEPSSDLSPE